VTTAHIRATDVHVDTANGRVTLHGKVTSRAQSDQSEAVARGIEGVTSVRNLLQVVPRANEKAVDAADERVKERVEKCLKEDSSLADSDISVRSVNNGLVLLSGKAQNLADHLHAVESTSSVPGVREVASEIKSSEEVPEPDPVRGSGKTKSSVRDAWITTATKLRLIGDSEVPALDVSVETNRGVVTLFGIVPSLAAKAKAEADAGKVDGVVSVDNQLQIVPSAKKELVEANDEMLLRNAKAMLKDRRELKHVKVEVKNGVAHLTGTVSSTWERLQAAIVIRGIDGIRAVSDDLRVERVRG
jgi:osmotically-inducible protein OsmY